MTRAALAALAPDPALLAKVAPKVVATNYDPTFRPWWEKPGMTLGMGMTEKQGGTDVRANITTATPAGDFYTIVGHKWFLSAPMCDAFLVLAQAAGGLTCFFVPRFRPDGSVNALRLQRLKDKLGNRSNASSEVEFAGAYALRVGDEGAGIRTIIQMVQLTRLDCGLASAGFMRMALAQAVHHCRYRSVFQRHLYDQPMMRAVLVRSGAGSRRRGGVGHAACARLRPVPPAIRAKRPMRGWSRPRRNTGSARRRRASSMKRWNASAATVMSRKACCRGFIARRRSMRSGKARATSCASTFCAHCGATSEAADFFADLAQSAAPLLRSEGDLFATMNDFESEAKARITVGKLATLAAAAALEATAPARRHRSLRAHAR